MSTALNLIADSAVERTPTREFAEAMSALASGVVLITCRVGDRPWGMTVTAFASVSADPPTVLASLGAEARSALAIKATRRFGISILADDQMAVARYGSRPGAAKFLERFVDSRGGGSPVIDGALAHLDCELGETVEAGDHTVLFGRVRAARTFHKGAPLVYHHRAFRTVTDPTTGRNVRCLSS
jgi:3-hydroxy-9,10-secoandrosta-1,3,5(10)-triene-9,17-dione monooxygenase reductase component